MSEDTKKLIMVVDDEEMLRDLFCSYLSSSGFDTYPCENGADAVDKFKLLNGKVDMVLLDIEMPMMRGPECFEKMKEINPAVKVIILSGYASDNCIPKMLKNGALGHIMKPTGMCFLLNYIKEHLAKD